MADFAEFEALHFDGIWKNHGALGPKAT